MDRPSDMQPARADRIRLTYEDYAAFPDDGRRHELIDGEHLVTPAPVARHQRISRRLFTALDRYLAAHPLGELFYAPLDVILSDHDVVQPDILFVLAERSAIVRDWVRGAPDLVAEILSPSSRRIDEVLKRRLYDRFGVREYWIVDPEIEIVKVYRRRDEAFAPPLELRLEDEAVLETPLFPGFSLTLASLFG